MTTDLSGKTIKEIREHFLAPQCRITENLLDDLRADGRKGVLEVALILERRIEERRLERRRLDRLMRFEKQLWNDGLKFVAGVDEAGVGPLAGPVVAAAVIFRPGTRIEKIDDSKKLNPELRLGLARQIKDLAESIGIATVEVETIDKLNIYHASLLAMRKAVEQLRPTPEHLLIDARQIPEIRISQECIFQGDARSFSIAAASIVAKTYRDQLMEKLDCNYPGYGFAEHKGYPTRQHQDAIREHGISPAHRRSFSVLEELMGNFSNTFYGFQRAIQKSVSLADLSTIKEEYSKIRKELSNAERRKLHILLRRRMKALSGR